MILNKFTASLGHHTLLQELIQHIQQRCIEAPAHASLMVGVKSVTAKWQEVVPFVFEPKDMNDAIECIAQWIPQLRGSRFLCACSHECVIYYVESDVFDLFTESRLIGDGPDDEVFIALTETMKRMRQSEKTAKQATQQEPAKSAFKSALKSVLSRLRLA